MTKGTTVFSDLGKLFGQPYKFGSGPSQSTRLGVVGRAQVEAFAAGLIGELTQEKFAELQTIAAATVSELRQVNRRREFFDGKRVLDELYRRHLHSSGLSKEIFVYLCAKEAAARISVAAFMESLFGALEIDAVRPSVA